MNAIDIVKEQVLAYDKGIAHAVVTIVHSDGSAPRTNGKMIVFSNGATKGTIGGGAVERMAVTDAVQCIREESNQLKFYDLTTPAAETGMTCGGKISVMIEVFTVRPLLVMCGAGHVGEAVLKLASFVGFDTMLIDTRDEKDIKDKIAVADRFVKVKDFEEDIKALSITPGAYFVIATYGHTCDGDALAAALTKKAAYVGMIGSSKKIAALFERLRSRGIEQSELDQVYTPIGLDLGGETPEEIAFSIVAEVLMVKNGRTGTHWAGKEK